MCDASGEEARQVVSRPREHLLSCDRRCMAEEEEEETQEKEESKNRCMNEEEEDQP